MDEVFYPELTREIKDMSRIVIEEKDIVCDVEAFEINKEKSSMNQVNEYLFEIHVAFNLTHKCKNGSIVLVEDIYRDYTFENIEESWKITANEFNYKIF